MVKPLRREVLLGGAALLLAPGKSEAAEIGPIAAIEGRVGGRLGVFARDLKSGRTLKYRADERFMLLSTFKGVLAAMVLWRIDAGHESLSAMVSYGEADLLPASPVTTAHVREGTLSVSQLCQAITSVSDNAAANLLLKRCGGPGALTAFVRQIGDHVTRFDRYETVAGIRSGMLDTTTPQAIADTAQRLLWSTVLSVSSRAQLERWMIGNSVGLTRLRASFPGNWVAGDRTGTNDGICNDYAFARLPDGRRLIMAAYHDAPNATMSVQESALRDVGAVIVAWQRVA